MPRASVPHLSPLVARGLSAVCALALAPLGCAGAEPADEDAFEAFRDQTEYLAQEDVYVVEGDLLLDGEDQLRRYFEERVEADGDGFRAIAYHYDDADIFVAAVRKINLSYCVSNEFNGSHAKVRDAMRAAASKWEVYADINFVHRPEFDDKCENSDLGVSDLSFTIERGHGTGWPFNALAFTPFSMDTTRQLLLTDDGLAQSNAQLERTMRHEIGHILGKRHEHMFDCNASIEGTSGRFQTPKDRGSIMWTQAVCGSGDAPPDFGLSRYDVLGAAYTYNLPTFHHRMEVFGSKFTMESDLNSDGLADALFVSDTPGVLTVAKYGQPSGGFISDVELGPYSTIQDKTPFFGRFSDTFGLSVDVFERAHNTTLDRVMHSVGDNLAVQPDAEPLNGQYVPLAGDFDGNGFTDLIHYRPGSQSDQIWMFDDDGVAVKEAFNVNGYYWPVVGDFDGDGRDDILWFDPEGETSPVWMATGKGRFDNGSRIDNAQKGLPLGTPYRPIVGDFDGDADDDIFWYRPGTESDRLWLSENGPAAVSSFMKVDGIYRPIVGDFDGDSVDDIFWYGQGDWSDSVWFFGSSLKTLSVGKDGDFAPFVGDFNGDSKSDILWYDPNSVQSSLWYGHSQNGFKPQTVSTTSHAYLMGFGPSTR